MSRAAAAQTVTGTIVARNDRSVVPGAIVVLLDSTGRAVATGLAEDSGTFVLTAPATGSYSIRVERVGFRSAASAAFVVRHGETVDVPMTIASAGVSLRAVKVSADRRCLVRPAEGLAAAQLWDEARKALSATKLTQLAQSASRSRRDPHRFTVRTRKFTRDLDPYLFRLRHEEQFEIEGETVTPFVTAAPDSLASEGYVVGTIEKGSTYYAPDAAILLSDRFLDTHCFRVQAADPNRRDDLIGLAFEPTRLTGDHRLPPHYVDVHGVLWLDRATAELRYMEYGYVDLPYKIPAEAAGGELEFRPLPDGRWIVWRWFIRVPHLQPRQKAIDPTMLGRTETQLELTSVEEGGAEILEVMPPGARNRRTATLRGIVTDSLRASAVVGARVFLSGTTFAAITSEDGSFTIDAIPPGKYTASVLTPRFDSLLLDPPARELTLSAGQEEHVDFAIPALRTVSTRLCPDVPSADTLSVLVGIIRDTSDIRAVGANVRAEWTEISKPSANQLATRPMSIEMIALAGGRYALCGLPPGKPISIRARRERNKAVVPGLHLRAGEVRRLDLTLRAP